MMAIGDGVCSDSNVISKQQYLARIRDEYVVVVPIDCYEDKQRIEIPYKEAVFVVVYGGFEIDWKEICELAPIF